MLKMETNLSGAFTVMPCLNNRNCLLLNSGAIVIAKTCACFSTEIFFLLIIKMYFIRILRLKFAKF